MKSRISELTSSFFSCWVQCKAAPAVLDRRQRRALARRGTRYRRVTVDDLRGHREVAGAGHRSALPDSAIQVRAATTATAGDAEDVDPFFSAFSAVSAVAVYLGLLRRLSFTILDVAARCDALLPAACYTGACATR